MMAFALEHDLLQTGETIALSAKEKQHPVAIVAGASRRRFLEWETK